MATNDTTATKGGTQTSATKSDAETKDYIVAPGRTVSTDDGDIGPEGTVTLPVKEGDKLQKLGFFRLDDGSIAGRADAGPETDRGIEIKES